MADDALISPRSRLSLWLDWYCSSPWRALLAWAVALTLAFILGELELFSRAYATAGTLEQYLGGRFPFPAGFLQELWAGATISLFYSWFEPVLLRLTLWRGLAWIGLGIIVSQTFQPYESTTWNHVSYEFLLRASPGIALLGLRSPGWVVLVATTCSVAILWFGNFASQLCWWAASVAYGAVLLFGTKRKTTPQPTRMSE